MGKNEGSATSENIKILTDKDQLGSAPPTTTSAGASGTTTSAGASGTSTGPAAGHEPIPNLFNAHDSLGKGKKK
jgi:hypothetical protein